MLLEAKIKRFFWQVMTGFSFLLLFGTFFLLDGCMTFEKAQRKYSKTVEETKDTTLTVHVPADSVAFQLATDTTSVTHEVRQGRARIVYRRTPKQTSVQAFCDTLVITKRIRVRITKRIWGVDPVYKEQAEKRLTIIYVLSAVIGVLLLSAVVYYLLTKRYRLSLTRRVDGAGTAA